MRSDQVPALDCLVRGHQSEDMVDHEGVYGSVCTHCGTAAYDADRLPLNHPWREDAIIEEDPL